MPLEIKQAEEEVRKRRWKWSVWLEGTEAELDEVERVVYYLHSSFPEPRREVTTRAGGFRLNASGWGTFLLGVEIHRASGEVENRTHQLEFSWGEPSSDTPPERGAPEKKGPERSVEGKKTPDKAAPPSKMIPMKGPSPVEEESSGGSVLLLHELDALDNSETLRKSLEEEGLSVADASSLAGSSWSKELVDSILSYDFVISVAEDQGGSLPVEAEIANKLGMKVLRLTPDLETTMASYGSKVFKKGLGVGDLSRQIAGSIKLDRW